jgi:hypothetical protein
MRRSKSRGANLNGWYGPGCSQGEKFSFWEGTLAQLEATLIAFQRAVE